MRKWITASGRVFTSFIQSLWARLTRRQQECLYRYVFIDDVPETLADYTVYLVGMRESPWLAAFHCPCGCGAELLLNLLPTERPCWSMVQSQKGTASLHPSVWRQVGCRSHFILREGRIQWCLDRHLG